MANHIVCGNLRVNLEKKMDQVSKKTRTVLSFQDKLIPFHTISRWQLCIKKCF